MALYVTVSLESVSEFSQTTSTVEMNGILFVVLFNRRRHIHWEQEAKSYFVYFSPWGSSLRLHAALLYWQRLLSLKGVPADITQGLKGFPTIFIFLIFVLLKVSV